MNRPKMAPKQNPNNPCPSDILAQIRTLHVEYVDFEGRVRSGLIEVNAAVVNDVANFFKRALEMRFPIEKVVRSSDPPYFWDDEKLMADNMSSGFNYRVIAGTDTVSQHGRGLALDINTRLNPCIRYQSGRTIVKPEGATWDPSLPGTLSADHPLVKYMVSLGWEWGGNWTAEDRGMIDYQHFEKAL